MSKSFKVRIYPKGGSSPIVFPGGIDPLGPYIELRPNGIDHKGEAVPGFRLSFTKDQVRALPPGSDADFEFLHPVPIDKVKT